MVQYIESACPSCHRPVRIRTEYLGKRIACKYCSYTFVAEVNTLPPPAAAAQTQPGPDAVTKQRIATLEEELRQARDELAIQASEHKTVALKLQEAQGELGQLREAAENLQRELDQARAGQSEVPNLEEKLTALQTEHTRALDELRNQFEAEKQALSLEWEQKHQAGAQAAEKLLTEEQNKAAQHHEKWQELENNRQALARDRERQERELVELRKAQEAASQQNKTLDQELQQTRQNLDRQTQELAALRKAHESASQQITSLTQELEQARQKEDAANKRINALSAETDGLKSEISRQKKLEQSQQEQLAQLQEELEKARAEAVAEHERSEEQHAVATRQFEKDRQSFRQVQEKLSREVAVLREEKEAVAKGHGEALDQACREKDAALQQHRGLEEELRSLRARVEQHAGSKGASDERVAKLEKDLQQARADAAAEREHLTQALSEEQKRNTAERQRWQEDLNTAQRQLERDRQSLEAELEDFRQQVASMRDLLSNMGIHV